jgi:hypothetical protein
VSSFRPEGMICGPGRPVSGFFVAMTSPVNRTPAGVLLLIFVTGAGVALGRRARASAGRAGSDTGQAREDGGCPGLA